MSCHPKTTATREANTRESRKKAVNVMVDAELITQARSANIKISSVVEQSLADAIHRVTRQHWLESNGEALKAYNRYIERHGIFAADRRGF